MLKPNRMGLRLLLLTVLFMTLGVAVSRGQQRESALSDGEVEKLRESAAEPAERVLVFVGFLDQRAKSIVSLSSGRRHAGREDDLHEMMEQFNSVAEDLQDNLDDYGPRHRDLRKSLPKLLAATERWQTMLKTPPDHEAYNVSRHLALESLADLRAGTVKLMDEQKAWFAAHPPGKEPVGQQE